MKILVTGATGYIGSHTVLELLEAVAAFEKANGRIFPMRLAPCPPDLFVTRMWLNTAFG